MNPIQCLMMAMAVLLIGANSSLAQGQGGDRTGNGGDGVVTSDGAIRLRDLVDPGNCTWKSGKSIYEQQPEIAKILDKLKKVNPYLAYGLSEQILKIKWCYTATLKKVDTNDDAESLTYYVDPYAQNKIQAGIRTVNNVYIDGSLLNADLSGGSMSVSDRPYFYIHEAMHAFLPMKTPMRNKRVRDAVHAMKDFNDGITNSDDLDAMIGGGGLLVPSNSSLIQDLFRILSDKTLSVQNRVALASPILDLSNNELATKQWIEIKDYISDDELVRLTELTGLTRFEFMKRAKDSLSFRYGKMCITFVNGFSKGVENLKASDLGRCTLSPLNNKWRLQDKYNYKISDKFTGRTIIKFEDFHSDEFFTVYKTECDFTPAQ